MFKKITLLGVMALLCLNFWAMAQTPALEIKPLKVGDKLPETFWKQEHTVYVNGKTTKQTLEQYRGKLLILDFWATWCGSCINKFNMLEKQQAKHANSLKVILVNSSSTRDTLEKIEQLMKGNKPPHQLFTLPTIIHDEYFLALFPHNAIPHYVWINEHGQICGISNSELMNVAQLDYLLEKQKP